ncbi:MAG: hypothetical protein K0S11_547 [Gammaproteobacteria bacterium]|jgi:hypothetical protein|nr:hypothetical protein [Gammaproteobacteria bacterium]
MLKSVLIKHLLLSLIMLGIAQVSLAAGNNSSLNMVDLLSQLQQKGYTGIYKVRQKDNVYIIKAVTEQGQQITLQVQRQNPNIPPLSREQGKYLTLLDAAKKVTTSGYHNIIKIKRSEHENRYKIRAYDNNNKPVKLYIDINTGKLTKSND